MEVVRLRVEDDGIHRAGQVVVVGVRVEESVELAGRVADKALVLDPLIVLLVPLAGVRLGGRSVVAQLHDNAVLRVLVLVYRVVDRLEVVVVAHHVIAHAISLGDRHLLVAVDRGHGQLYRHGLEVVQHIHIDGDCRHELVRCLGRALLDKLRVAEAVRVRSGEALGVAVVVLPDRRELCPLGGGERLSARGSLREVVGRLVRVDGYDRRRRYLVKAVLGGGGSLGGDVRARKQRVDEHLVRAVHLKAHLEHQRIDRVLDALRDLRGIEHFPRLTAERVVLVLVEVCLKQQVEHGVEVSARYLAKLAVLLLHLGGVQLAVAAVEHRVVDHVAPFGYDRGVVVVGVVGRAVLDEVDERLYRVGVDGQVAGGRAADQVVVDGVLEHRAHELSAALERHAALRKLGRGRLGYLYRAHLLVKGGELVEIEVEVDVVDGYDIVVLGQVHVERGDGQVVVVPAVLQVLHADVQLALIPRVERRDRYGLHLAVRVLVGQRVRVALKLDARRRLRRLDEHVRRAVEVVDSRHGGQLAAAGRVGVCRAVQLHVLALDVDVVEPLVERVLAQRRVEGAASLAVLDLHRHYRLRAVERDLRVDGEEQLAVRVVLRVDKHLLLVLDNYAVRRRGYDADVAVDVVDDLEVSVRVAVALSDVDAHVGHAAGASRRVEAVSHVEVGRTHLDRGDAHVVDHLAVDAAAGEVLGLEDVVVHGAVVVQRERVHRRAAAFDVFDHSAVRVGRVGKFELGRRHPSLAARAEVLGRHVVLAQAVHQSRDLVLALYVQRAAVDAHVVVGRGRVLGVLVGARLEQQTVVAVFGQAHHTSLRGDYDAAEVDVRVVDYQVVRGRLGDARDVDVDAQADADRVARHCHIAVEDVAVGRLFARERRRLLGRYRVASVRLGLELVPCGARNFLSVILELHEAAALDVGQLKPRRAVGRLNVYRDEGVVPILLGGDITRVVHRTDLGGRDVRRALVAGGVLASDKHAYRRLDRLVEYDYLVLALSVSVRSGDTHPVDERLLGGGVYLVLGGVAGAERTVGALPSVLYLNLRVALLGAQLEVEARRVDRHGDGPSLDLVHDLALRAARLVGAKRLAVVLEYVYAVCLDQACVRGRAADAQLVPALLAASVGVRRGHGAEEDVVLGQLAHVVVGYRLVDARLHHVRGLDLSVRLHRLVRPYLDVGRQRLGDAGQLHFAYAVADGGPDVVDLNVLLGRNVHVLDVRRILDRKVSEALAQRARVYLQVEVADRLALAEHEQHQLDLIAQAVRCAGGKRVVAVGRADEYRVDDAVAERELSERHLNGGAALRERVEGGAVGVDILLVVKRGRDKAAGVGLVLADVHLIDADVSGVQANRLHLLAAALRPQPQRAVGLVEAERHIAARRIDNGADRGLGRVFAGLLEVEQVGFGAQLGDESVGERAVGRDEVAVRVHIEEERVARAVELGTAQRHALVVGDAVDGERVRLALEQYLVDLRVAVAGHARDMDGVGGYLALLHRHRHNYLMRVVVGSELGHAGRVVDKSGPRVRVAVLACAVVELHQLILVAVGLRIVDLAVHRDERGLGYRGQLERRHRRAVRHVEGYAQFGRVAVLLGVRDVAVILEQLRALEIAVARQTVEAQLVQLSLDGRRVGAYPLLVLRADVDGYRAVADRADTRYAVQTHIGRVVRAVRVGRAVVARVAAAGVHADRRLVVLALDPQVDRSGLLADVHAEQGRQILALEVEHRSAVVLGDVAVRLVQRLARLRYLLGQRQSDIARVARAHSDRRGGERGDELRGALNAAYLIVVEIGAQELQRVRLGKRQILPAAERRSILVRGGVALDDVDKPVVLELASRHGRRACRLSADGAIERVGVRIKLVRVVRRAERIRPDAEVVSDYRLGLNSGLLVDSSLDVRNLDEVAVLGVGVAHLEDVALARAVLRDDVEVDILGRDRLEARILAVGVVAGRVVVEYLRLVVGDLLLQRVAVVRLAYRAAAAGERLSAGGVQSVTSRERLRHVAVNYDRARRRGCGDLDVERLAVLRVGGAVIRQRRRVDLAGDSGYLVRGYEHPVVSVRHDRAVYQLDRARVYPGAGIRMHYLVALLVDDYAARVDNHAAVRLVRVVVAQQLGLDGAVLERVRTVGKLARADVIRRAVDALRLAAVVQQLILLCVVRIVAGSYDLLDARVGRRDYQTVELAALGAVLSLDVYRDVADQLLDLVYLLDSVRVALHLGVDDRSVLAERGGVEGLLSGRGVDGQLAQTLVDHVLRRVEHHRRVVDAVYLDEARGVDGEVVVRGSQRAGTRYRVARAGHKAQLAAVGVQPLDDSLTVLNVDLEVVDNAAAALGGGGDAYHRARALLVAHVALADQYPRQVKLYRLIGAELYLEHIVCRGYRAARLRNAYVARGHRIGAVAAQRALIGVDGELGVAQRLLYLRSYPQRQRAVVQVGRVLRGYLAADALERLILVRAVLLKLEADEQLLVKRSVIRLRHVDVQLGNVAAAARD